MVDSTCQKKRDYFVDPMQSAMDNNSNRCLSALRSLLWSLHITIDPVDHIANRALVDSKVLSEVSSPADRLNRTDSRSRGSDRD